MRAFDLSFVDTGVKYLLTFGFSVLFAHDGLDFPSFCGQWHGLSLMSCFIF